MNTTEQTTEYNKTTKKDFPQIDPRIIIEEDGFNTRLTLGNIDELKKSIIKNGIRIPLRGYKSGENYILTDGHRRLAAIKMAIAEGNEIARVPFISEKITSKEERTFEILLSNSGEPLTPIEMAITYQRLINFGYTITEIAERTGKSYNSVHETLLLNTATKNTVNFIRENKVSSSVVRDLLKKNSPEETEHKIKKVIHEISIEKDDDNVSSKDTRKRLVEKKFSKKEVEELLKKQIEAIAKLFPHKAEQINKVEIIKF